MTYLCTWPACKAAGCVDCNEAVAMTTKPEHGSDLHLSLLGAQWHLNLLTGQDRADMLAFGRACMAAERERCAKLREASEFAAHQLEKARIWNGTDWHYNPLHPLHYRSALERLRDAIS